MRFVNEIEGLLHRLGIGVRYVGFRYMAVCIDLAAVEPDRLLNVSKRLYPEVARRCGLDDPMQIERNLRTVIRTCWDYGNRPLLSLLAGYNVIEKPSCVEFIDILSGYIRRNRLSEEGPAS